MKFNIPDIIKNATTLAKFFVKYKFLGVVAVLLTIGIFWLNHTIEQQTSLDTFKSDFKHDLKILNSKVDSLHSIVK